MNIVFLITSCVWWEGNIESNEKETKEMVVKKAKRLPVKKKSSSKKTTKKRTNALTQYRKRRDTRASGEPAGRTTRTTAKTAPDSKKRLRFVVQKHDASHLHYDLRLEIGSVLVSWAVPKGIARSPAIKRLAVRTDNHPLAYAHFSGTIPEGHYGAGTVEIWDRGFFKNVTMHHGKEQSLSSALRAGKIEFVCSGKKMKGPYVLIRIKTKPHEQWLLKKVHKK